MATGHRRTLPIALVMVVLTACSAPTPSLRRSDAATPTSAPPSVRPAPTETESHVSATELVVEIVNRDDVEYQIAWAPDGDRVAWTVEPDSVAHLEVATDQAGGLLLTRECNFIGTWEGIEPGSYRIVVEIGVATLTPVAAIGASPKVVATEPCPYQGP